MVVSIPHVIWLFSMSENVKFGAADITVISILWSFELVSYWFRSLSHYTAQVLFPNDELWSAYFRSNQTWILLTSCSVTLIVAFLVEAFDHKYATSLAGLCLCLSTPFIAVFSSITKLAGAAVLMFWTSSIIFVVSPATYSLVFNQNLNPARRHVRYLVSSFECIQILIGKYLMFLCIPESANGSEHEQYLVIVVWVTVLPLLVTLITLVDRMKKYVTGDFINERGIKRILYGICSDIRVQPPRRKGRSMIEAILFVLLLLPALTITTLDVALSNLTSDDDANVQSPVLKHILFSAEAMVIPFTELALSLTSALKDAAVDMIMLGIAHVANIAVVSLLIFRMDHNHHIGNRGLFGGVVEQPRAFVDTKLPSPGPGYITYVFLSDVKAILETDPPALFVDGASTETVDANGIIYGKYDLPKDKIGLSFSLRCTKVNTSPLKPPTVLTVLSVVEKKHYTFIISGNQTYIKCWMVVNMDRVTPKPAPQLIFLNSFTKEVVDGIPVVLYNETFLIESEYGYEKEYPLPNVAEFSVHDLPVGQVKVSYLYSGTDPYLVVKLRARDVITTEPFSIYLATMLVANNMHMNLLQILGTGQMTTTISPPVTSNPKPTPKKPDVFQQSSYALLGTTFGIASVGYTHFFWVESPLRLRAVLYALFRVSNLLVGWFTEEAVGNTLTRPKAIGLLSLQVITTVWHLGLSWIFQARTQSVHTIQ